MVVREVGAGVHKECCIAGTTCFCLVIFHLLFNPKPPPPRQRLHHDGGVDQAPAQTVAAGFNMLPWATEKFSQPHHCFVVHPLGVSIQSRFCALDLDHKTAGSVFGPQIPQKTLCVASGSNDIPVFLVAELDEKACSPPAVWQIQRKNSFGALKHRSLT